MKPNFFIVFLFIAGCFSDRPVKVTIEVHAPETDDSTRIFIAGNNPQMGNWHPGRIQMEHAGAHLWRKAFQYKAGTILEYKITLGNWDSEAADAEGNAFQNSVLKVRRDTTARSTIHYWKRGSDGAIAGQITGEVQYHRDLADEGLLPRDLIVWLPPGYDENTDQHYPVLYMHDGQNIVDPQTSTFGTDWQIDETADSLIRSAQMEPLIVVGIYNTRERRAEYTPSPKGERYRKFVIETVKPLIDRTYRTKPQPEHTATGGSSAGGTVAFLLTWKHPEVFSMAICLSPAFKIDDIDCVQMVQAYDGPRKQIQVYIYNGGTGLEEHLQPGIDEMMEALDRNGYRCGKDYFWHKDSTARHSEADWAKQMPQMLKWLYGT